MALGNHSTITEFFLLVLSADPRVQALLFVLFLVIYLLTLMGNLTMLLVIRTDSHLHTPMYFFVSHLSFLDLCYSSVTVPKLLENLLSQSKTISVGGCQTQVFFVFVTVGTEGCLLSVMSYDCYDTIYHCLHYGQIMTNRLCNRLVYGSWGLSFLDAFINILQAMSLDFCEDQSIPHYSCGLPSLFLLSCSDVSTSFTVLLCSSLVHGFGTYLLIILSYALIASTILSISSSSGSTSPGPTVLRLTPATGLDTTGADVAYASASPSARISPQSTAGESCAAVMREQGGQQYLRGLRKAVQRLTF
ncbi:olfactory receptor 8S1-like [Manis pentadactyla]|uniref:olfactory receptor 8S1-like n=1 Tax=Manis pentadactyla TaxID=143292 RepID=UPI00255C87BB|nr:olfactory receptor 8S1-like [Manis pentadactyla]